MHSFLVNLEIVEFDMMMLKYPHKKNLISKAGIKKQHEGIVKRIADISKSFESTIVMQIICRTVIDTNNHHCNFVSLCICYRILW
jgi:hypothetical protein